MKGQEDLLGAMHDVSNALTVILGWVAELKNHPEKLEPGLSVLEKKATLARDLARRAIGVNVTTVEEHDLLGEAVRDTVESLSVLAKPSNVELELKVSAEEAPLLGASQLGQVLSNLVLNAIAFSPEGGKVSIHAFEDRDKIYVDVSDQGPGLEQSAAGNLFVTRATTREGGAGIGLSYARTVAQSNGGTLELAQAKPHATFRIVWPKAGSLRPPRPTKPPVKDVVPEKPLQGRHILVVEDDHDILDLLEFALSSRGAKVTRSASPEIIATIQENVDCALFDLSPIQNQVDTVLEMFQMRWPSAGLVFISGTVANPPSWTLISSAKWVRKPFEVSEVIEAVLEVSPKRS